MVSLRVLVCLLAIILPLRAFAADLPTLSGRVVDTAGLIDPQAEAALTQKLEAFEKRSSDQFVIATIPSLGGEAIEPYANRLFRTWKLGQAGEDNGVLLLVARDDRKMRIEVGYGLEGTLTDLLSGQIIRNTLVPAFRAGDYSGGISKASDDIIAVLGGNGAEVEARFERNQRQEDEGIPPVLILFLIAWVGIFVVGFGSAMLPPLLGRRLGPNRYRWLGMDFDYTKKRSQSGGWVVGTGSGSGWSSGSSGGGWSSGSSGGGFSGGGGSSGGGGASGSW